MKTRGSGILLHVTSLPSAYGIGDLGPGAYRFIDFLAANKQCYWQILPLNPTSSVMGNSPYSSVSAFAGNVLLIDPEQLISAGYLTPEDLEELRALPHKHVAYCAVEKAKQKVYDRAFERFRAAAKPADYDQFLASNNEWLRDYTLFTALKGHYEGRCFCDWPEQVRDRDQSVLAQLRDQLCEPIERETFLQYLFFRQWSALKRYACERGVAIIGDMPIYVTYDSCDVWAHPWLFKLDERKMSLAGAGVPPDYFSETGQLWGNPVYRWDVMQQNGYSWWISRIRHNLKLFDYVRIDHFRGFISFWEIPAGEKTAINGTWMPVPYRDFFSTVVREFPDLPIIAEDLGIITQDVRDAMHEFGFPGMKVLMFAFGDGKPENDFLPHNYERSCVAYTGTHDNNTVRGWFESEATPEEKERFYRYAGCRPSLDTVHREFIRLLMASVAHVVIIPLQDVLGLRSTCRMNLPAITHNNWEWRAAEADFDPQQPLFIKDMAWMYSRCAEAACPGDMKKPA